MGLLVGVVIGAVGIWVVQPDESWTPQAGESRREAPVGRRRVDAPDARIPPPPRALQVPNLDEARKPRGEDGLPVAAPSRVWSREDLLAAVRALAEGTGARGRNLNHYAGFAREIWRRRVKIPSDLVGRLIESEEMNLRWLGLRLVGWGSDIPMEPPRAIATSDPSPVLRAAALDACARLLKNHPDLAGVIAAAAHDPSASVRARSLHWLGYYASRDRPGFAGLILAATRDPDRAVRRAATSALGSAGAAGAARAVELIRAGSYDRDELEELVSTATHHGQGLQLLGDKPSPEVVTLLIESLDGDESGETLRALRGRFGELLPLYQPGGDGHYDQFFRLAAESGDLELLGRVITDRSQPRRARLDALEIGLEDEKARRSCVTAAWAMIRDRRNPARLRAQVLERVLDRIEGAEEWAGELRGILEDAAADPSVWVREPAREALRDLDDEDED
jgi:HEAT repeats